MRTQTIILKNMMEVIIDHDSKSKCKKCNKDIVWGLTKNKKPIPLELVSLSLWDTHYATCPNADEFRKKKEVKNET